MKKKIILNLFLFVACLFAFNNVNADMGAPATESYDVVVSKIGGTEFYVDGETVSEIIPYDTKLTITMENKRDGVWRGYINYNGENGYVILDDVSLIEKEFSLEDATKLDGKQEVIIINKEGAYLYSGPSKIYSVVSEKIPTGTKLTYEYVDKGHVWAYVEYEGKKGWIYIFNMVTGPYGLSYVVPTTSDDKYLIIDENTNLYDYPTTDSKVVLDKIEKGKELTCKYSFTSDPLNYWCYTEYNNTEGWLRHTFNSTTAQKYDYDVILLAEDGLNIYSDIYETSKETLDAEKYSIVRTLYCWTTGRYQDMYLYIEHNGQKGWIKDEYQNTFDVSIINQNNDLNLYIGEDEIQIYDDFDLQNKSDKILSQDEFSIIFYKDNKRYIEHNGKYGWVNGLDLDDCLKVCVDCKLTLDDNEKIYSEMDKDSDELGELEEGSILDIKFKPYGQEGKNNKWYYVEVDDVKGWIYTKTDYVVSTEIVANNKLIEKLEKEVPKNSLEPNQIILICVGGAAVLAITAIVTIILINKKKKNRKKEIVANTEKKGEN